ncbi:MAG: hypothetical protein ACRENH_17595, partial [Gemmatimonadaceae bacterium]
RILRFGDADYALDSANVVIIDRVDAVGGPPMVMRHFTLRLPIKVSMDTLSDSLRVNPALQEFIH